jgi:hypothetical protein
MADFGDCRDIAEEPEEAELVLFRVRGGIIEGGPGHPAQLLLDLPDELLLSRRLPGLASPASAWPLAPRL